jgi:hypothetical protein
LLQGSAATASDAGLESAATSAIADVLRDWRSRRVAQLGIGATATVQGSTQPATTTTVTRISRELFWIVAEVTRPDGAVRRQNLIVRIRIPATDSLPALVFGGDATLSSKLSIVRDSVVGCSGNGPDVVVGITSRVNGADGSLPLMQIMRVANTDSAANAVGSALVDSLIAHPELELAGGTSREIPSGVVHVSGDLIITGGSGTGILVVDGMLEVVGAVRYAGIIVARGGLRITADGSSIEGSIRVPGSSAAAEIVGATTVRTSACTSEVVISQSLTPKLASGRRWAEMY